MNSRVTRKSDGARVVASTVCSQLCRELFLMLPKHWATARRDMWWIPVSDARRVFDIK